MTLTVLSLFDGMSCGQLALQRAGITDYTYYASEIEKEPIKVTQHHFPNTIQIGDVTKVRYKDGILYSENGEFEVGRIDLLTAGSPCQDLSKCKSKDGKGLNGEKSKLFYEFERLLKEIKPSYFLLENVLMNEESENIINNSLNVKPYLINSDSVSAQDRKRLYWTNIPFDNTQLTHPIDTVFKDIQEYDVSEKYYLDDEFENEINLNKRMVGNLVRIKPDGKRKYLDMSSRVYNVESKIPTLTTISGGGQHKKVYDVQRQQARKLTPLEYERLQTVPDNYTQGVSNTARYSMLGNGWTVDVIAHIFKGIYN